MKFKTLVLTYPNGIKGYYDILSLEKYNDKVIRIIYENNKGRKYAYNNYGFYKHLENEPYHWHKHWTGWVPNRIYPISAVIIPAHFMNVRAGYCYNVPKEDIIHVF